MKLLAVGGARISRSVLADAAALGLPIFQGYGLSETASVIALNVPNRNRPGSVGRPLPSAVETSDEHDPNGIFEFNITLFWLPSMLRWSTSRSS
jgi:long-subunit acyl-CoA synthetase (AMP-forming)